MIGVQGEGAKRSSGGGGGGGTVGTFSNTECIYIFMSDISEKLKFLLRLQLLLLLIRNDRKYNLPCMVLSVQFRSVQLAIKNKTNKSYQHLH